MWYNVGGNLAVAHSTMFQIRGNVVAMANSYATCRDVQFAEEMWLLYIATCNVVGLVAMQSEEMW